MGWQSPASSLDALEDVALAGSTGAAELQYVSVVLKHHWPLAFLRTRGINKVKMAQHGQARQIIWNTGEEDRRSVTEMTLNLYMNLFAFVNQNMSCVLPALDSCLQVFRKKPVDSSNLSTFHQAEDNTRLLGAELAAGSGLENSRGKA